VFWPARCLFCSVSNEHSKTVVLCGCLWTRQRVMGSFGAALERSVQERVVGRRGGISSCPQRSSGSSVLATGNVALVWRLRVLVLGRSAVAPAPSCGGVAAQTGKQEQDDLCLTIRQQTDSQHNKNPMMRSSLSTFVGCVPTRGPGRTV
jgi:hypothetical protein